MDIASLKLPELKRECKARGLPTSGNKADLVARLQAALTSKGGKPPSEDSNLDDALIDEDSMLDDDSGTEDNMLSDLTTASIDLSSPTVKKAPVAMMRPVSTSPVKIMGAASPVKKVEPLKRPGSTATAAGDNTGASPPKKKITLNREPVEAPAHPEPQRTLSTDGGDKNVVKVSAVPLTAEEKAKLRAQKFGNADATASSTTPAAAVKPAASNGVPAHVDEKLKQRAARFNAGGDPVVPLEKKISLTTEDDVKLQKRKERFGVAAEDAKKQSRSERFGATATAPASDSANDKKALRAARFGSS